MAGNWSKPSQHPKSRKTYSPTADSACHSFIADNNPSSTLPSNQNHSSSSQRTVDMGTCPQQQDHPWSKHNDERAVQPTQAAQSNTSTSYSPAETAPYFDYQLNRWVYATSNSDVTLYERLAKSNWEGQCLERL
jgi:hypothetical protein